MFNGQQYAVRSGPTRISKGAGILLVEDESQLRELMTVVLEARRFQVFAASSGPEALRLWRNHRDKIGILFTDIILPDGMSGIELAEKVAGEDRELPIVITSGYQLDSIDDAAKVRELGRFVPKPYVPTDILRLFQELLEV